MGKCPMLIDRRDTTMQGACECWATGTIDPRKLPAASALTRRPGRLLAIFLDKIGTKVRSL